MTQQAFAQGRRCRSSCALSWLSPGSEVKAHLVMCMQGLNLLVPLGAHLPLLQVLVELMALAGAFVDSIGALLCCANLGIQP